MRLILQVIAAALLLRAGGALGREAKPESVETPTRTTRIVVLGDSITKGVRSGVEPRETFAAMVERDLRADGIPVEVQNLGIGGERTDQALKRLDAVAALRPRWVTVMYGTNDSYVDKGASQSRLSVGQYRENLKSIVAVLLSQGIEPILMTEPRWADDASPNGVGENPNVRLESYVEACRAVAAECRVPLVDHFARWTAASSKGVMLRDWTTDGCHPNPRGHRELADALLTVLRMAARPGPVVVPFSTRLDTILTHYDGRFLWYHPRAAAYPDAARGTDPTVLITIQKHLHSSDHYSGLSDLRSTDLGRSWIGPTAIPELDWVREPNGVNIAAADITPMYHAKSGKILAVGAQVRYSPDGKQLDDQPRAHQTVYAAFDPKTGRWTKWRRIEMPASDSFNFARSACAQFVVMENGDILLPFYIATSSAVPYAVTVARCTFDGETLTHRESGDVLKLDIARGLYEPSLLAVAGRYLLTIRNDKKGYVTSGLDGLHYRPVKPWLFDDGEELGSYNTQQHWLSHWDVPFLVYTRKGANNDHIPRHRAPLFMAQVDPDRLEVIRSSEKIIVPERGAELGNFGATRISDRESWVTVAEGVWNDDARRRGAKGAVFAARVSWGDPSPVSPLAKTRGLLESGGPVRVVCFGDSVTGVYYHTGSRRAYTDMLGIALRRIHPKADIRMINAGISGNTTSDALQRIDRDVLAHRPTLVTVMFGLNDMTRVPIDRFRENLGRIAEKCRQAGAEVVFCTPNNVITTGGRPSEKLLVYVEAIRDEARKLGIPAADVHAEFSSLRERDPNSWRLSLSDEIHPNMDGHKRIAESIARTITGRFVDLTDVPPPSPALVRVRERVERAQPIRVLAMPPFDGCVGAVVESAFPGAKVEVTRWPTEGRSLLELEADARGRVRPASPDLVVISMPRSKKGDPTEAVIHAQSWIMNSSLSFGAGGWDCIVVHPSVISPDPDPSSAGDARIRRLVRAQDLPLLDRGAGDGRSPERILSDWFQTKPWRAD